MHELHRTHSGIEACLRLARDYVFWPRMAVQLKDPVLSCGTCASFSPTQRKETLGDV